MEEMDSTSGEHDAAIPLPGREKIIFGIDLDQSMDEYFILGEKTNETRINRTKQLLKWFIEQKSCWDSKHEFAIMILGEKAVWHMDFTSDTVLLSHAIDELYTMGNFKAFDTTSMFKEVLEHINLDEVDGSSYRLIMIYTRSDVIPSVPDRNLLDVLYSSGKFFCDCVYIHLKSSESTGPVKPQHVYDRLTDIEDPRAPGYYYELTRIFKKYCSVMAELLAHPYVRPLQDSMDFRMAPPPSVTQEEELEITQKQEQLHLDQVSVHQHQARRQQQQLQQQQQYQQQQLQQMAQISPKRSDPVSSYQSPEAAMAGVIQQGLSSQKSQSFLNTPSAPSSSSLSSHRPPPSRPLPSAPALPGPAPSSPYKTSISQPTSSRDGERSVARAGSRTNIDMPRPGSSANIRQMSGSGGSSTGSGTSSKNLPGSGSGTGVDDAILI
ncbi:hypothetical protein BCR41DRAFT_420931 [Lobosporangium transversale]|uniref:BRISC and BRCA1-A complex member 1 n=1 Tax=Lobosporangium transversale TaxID=64571 RepID=A0A1Y2GRX4_9FUNG|nr:hypothetical protein BCR41DRAFT_420931 [Lobosporangium transversale]ORZ20887.1 hypothetical protein BCR41DRAFT_420931 [Lobosporangium transversale]|eukprot:XP_021882796.1 hypothetical protein BCR41DRAFT_420931 [Lobosporangium transversale]